MQICSKCKVQKPLTEFYKCSANKSGHSVWCKVCHNTHMSTYARAKREIERKSKNIIKEVEYKRNYSIYTDFYVYVHLRKTDGLPMYVGKGRGNRAWFLTKRSSRWRRSFCKHGVIVLLLYTGLTEEEAFLKEKQAIHDLRNYSRDTMTNHTDGGEGNSQEEQVSNKKKQIMDFCIVHGRRPNYAIAEERRLAKWCANYTSPSVACYDPVFKEKLIEVAPSLQGRHNRRSQ